MGWTYEEGWTLVGHVGVDSGQLCISDPCYDWDYDKDILPIALKAIDAGRSVYSFNDGITIIASTLYGDGMYPVYVKYDGGGRATAMMVDFEENDDDYAEWEGESWEDEVEDD